MFSVSKKGKTSLRRELLEFCKQYIDELQLYAKYLYDRSATLMAAFLIGFLSQKYLPLVNDKSQSKSRQIIKLAVRKEAFSVSVEYCQVILETMDKLADIVWNKNDGNYLRPEFRIVFEENSLVVGPVALGLLDF